MVEAQYRRAERICAALAAAPVLLLLGPGGLLLAGRTQGAVLLAPAILLAYLIVFLDAWVLLVEINR